MTAVGWHDILYNLLFQIISYNLRLTEHLLSSFAKPSLSLSRSAQTQKRSPRLNKWIKAERVCWRCWRGITGPWTSLGPSGHFAQLPETPPKSKLPHVASLRRPNFQPFPPNFAGVCDARRRSQLCRRRRCHCRKSRLTSCFSYLFMPSPGRLDSGRPASQNKENQPAGGVFLQRWERDASALPPRLH